MNIPFLSFHYCNRQIKPEITDAFERFFDASVYILGNEGQKFENAYALFNQTKYAIGISNGLDALQISLKALGIEKGDEVIVPSNTYIATVLSITHMGATPVFSEPEIGTYNLNPGLIEEAITQHTKAIMPVHLYGLSCNMEPIMQLANKYDLKVIEDNAQAHGAILKNKITGSWGHINATSFYPGKNFGALGDAGAITTNDENLAILAKCLRNYGSQKKYFNEVIGYNMRLDECQAAFLSVKLKYLDGWTKERQKIAGWYHEGLKELTEIILPSMPDDGSHVYHIYMIRYDRRDELQTYLERNGIGTLIHYPVPPHLQNAYSSMGFRKGDFPIAEKIAASCLSLPIYPGLTIDDVGFICDSIKKFYYA